MLEDVLIAVAVVAAVGLLAGIILAVANHFMGIKEDERYTTIRACLPGANCGACGCSGCDDYAKAVFEGTAKPNLCIPGGNDVAEELSRILGVEAEDVKLEVAFVHCNGTPSATSRKVALDSEFSCRSASMFYGGPGSCSYGCLGYGDCVAVCPVEAIHIKNGVARVDSRECVGCGLCAKTCPKNLISLISRDVKTVNMCSNHDKGAVTRKACKNGCIACGKCQKVCPEGAITVENNLAHVNYEKCTGCGICVDACPVKCLKHTDFFHIPESL